MTTVAIQGTEWLINGRLTYPGTPAEGLLMNLRAVNSTFEDTTRSEFDPDANTAAFLRALPLYRDAGMRAITLNLQGGMPGYEGAVNSALNPDGSLRPAYLARVARVIEACDALGMVVILGVYYQRQSGLLRDADAVRAGVAATARWLLERGDTHVLLEVANEYDHTGFVHPIIREPAGQVELMAIARKAHPRLLVSTSSLGHGMVNDEVGQAGDFQLLHFNGTPLKLVPQRIREAQRFDKPVLCNEDVKLGEDGARVAALCVAGHCGWGLMHQQRNQHLPFTFTGTDDDPITYGALIALTTSDRVGHNAAL